MNNYNQSNTGLNIELNIFYDTFMSQCNCNDNFVKLRGDTWQYVDYGNIEKLDNDDLITISKEEPKKLFKYYKDKYGYTPYQNYNYSCMDDALSDIISDILNEDLKEVIYTLDQYNIPYIENYEHGILRGYSQGDAIEVIIPHKLMDIWGLSKEDFLKQLPELKEELHKYVYDAPIYGSLTINDREFYIHDYIDSYDVYDRDIIIEAVLKEEFNGGIDKLLLKEELESIFPYELEYS